MARRIVFYRTARGECPVDRFLESLPARDQQKVFWVLRLIEEIPRVPAEYFKKLSGTEEIWECRIKSGTNAYRVFGFFFDGQTLVLTHGYSKKTQKTDRRQIRQAESYRRDYLSRKQRR